MKRSLRGRCDVERLTRTLVAQTTYIAYAARHHARPQGDPSYVANSSKSCETERHGASQWLSDKDHGRTQERTAITLSPLSSRVISATESLAHGQRLDVEHVTTAKMYGGEPRDGRRQHRFTVTQEAAHRRSPHSF